MRGHIAIPIAAGLLLAGLASGNEIDVPIAEDPGAVRLALKKAASEGKVFVVDLMKGTRGTLAEGYLENRLAPGRYRLHVSLTMSPLGHPQIRDIEIAVKAGDYLRKVTTFDFRASDQFRSLALEFSNRRTGRTPVSIQWAVGKASEMNRAKSQTPNSSDVGKIGLDIDTEEEEDNFDEDIELGRDEDGSVTVENMKKLEFRLAIRSAVVERILPLEITRVAVNKILYQPGEKGQVQVTIHNHGEQESSGELSLSFTRELTDTRSVPAKSLTIGPGKDVTVEYPFVAEGRFGTSVRTMISSERRRHMKEDFFSVSEDFFEVGVGSYWGSSMQTGLGKHREVPTSARGVYSNMMELFFWAPCDWAKLVSPYKKWWSGQADYYESEDNLKELLDLCHQQGIKVSFYASANPAGPFGWEVARKHPEWYARTASGGLSSRGYNVEHLDHWNDEEWRSRENVPDTGWYVLGLDLRQLAPLDYGIDQIIESVRHYNWDGVRFDGHYGAGNAAVSTRNMRRLKKRVWKEIPDFRFGFNYGRAPEFHGGVTHEMREGMAGGGCYLQEGITNWRYTRDQYKSWKHYASNELKVAKTVQKLGGSYFCIWSLDRSEMTPSQRYYKYIFGLIAGGHPFYGTYASVPGCSNWGAFMTRWSSMIWDHNLRAAPKEAERFGVKGDRVMWKPLVQERVESPQRKFVILHLVTAPTDDFIGRSQKPIPAGKVKVWYRPHPGQSVTGVTLARPDHTPFEQQLEPQTEKQGLHVIVPDLRHWAMVIWEVSGNFSVPVAPPRFTEPPDPAEVKKGTLKPLIIRHDPNKEDAEEEGGPGTIIKLLNHGSSGVGPQLIADSQSEAGTVEWRPFTERSGRVGMSWVGPLTPGKHKIRIRMKWVDPEEKPSPQQISIRVTEAGTDRALCMAFFVTPDFPKAPKGCLTLGERGKYLEYPLGAFEKKKTGYIHVYGTASTPKLGQHTVYLDRLAIEQTERYGDAKASEYLELLPKPEDLRSPRGDRPTKALLVKGMFWNQYLKKLNLDIAGSYRLPGTHEGLYRYDAIVLCNYDFTNRLPDRKRLKEYVEDGGRLVLLGGCFALGQGGVLHTFIDEMLPVQCGGPYEVVPCEPQAILGPTSESSYPDKPALFWRHLVKPRPNSTVLAWANKYPIAVKGNYGKGQVLVYAGTVLGEGDKEMTPFWNTDSWKHLFKRLVFE